MNFLQYCSHDHKFCEGRALDGEMYAFGDWFDLQFFVLHNLKNGFGTGISSMPLTDRASCSSEQN